MGVFSRLLFGEEEDEDDDEEEESRLNYQNHNISSVKRFSMLFVFGGITIYKAVKGLFWKFISIFFHAKPKPKPKPPYPFLPLHNPPPTQPLLAPPISSPTCTFDDVDGDDLECGHDVHRENLARRQLLPLQNPASTSTNTEPLLHLSALVSSPTTILDDDDRQTSSTIIDGEDRVLGCPEEIYRYQSVDNHVVASGMMPAFVEENEIPFPKKEDKKTRKLKMKRQRQKEKKSVIVVVEERWIKHYSSYHRILLVGEGNFSFSACLAKAFCCASNIIATSLDSEAFLKENYKKASSNIEELKSRGSKVMHGIDATTMADHRSPARPTSVRSYSFQLPLRRVLPLLVHRKPAPVQFLISQFFFWFCYFLRLVDSKLTIGLFTINEVNIAFKISTCMHSRHRRLVSMFMKNAKEMIGEDGEIHISHKTNGFHAQFELESIASSHGLRLTEAVKFECSDYPGYNTKYGFGGDKNFNCVPSNTFKFGLKTEP